MYSTKFCYYTNAKCRYPSPIIHLPFRPILPSPKCSKWETGEYSMGKVLHRKRVRNMSTRENPGTLPISLYLTGQPPTSQPFGFGKVREVQGDTTFISREGEGEERSRELDLVQFSGDIVCLVLDGRPWTLTVRVKTRSRRICCH